MVKRDSCSGRGRAVMTLFTIGYTKKPLRACIQLLREAAVDVVVDVRRRNTGQLAGWAKRDDLAFILETFGIEYRHFLEVAPSDELLDRYRRDHDWDRYVVEFGAQIGERGVLPELQAFLDGYERPCLLCSEHEPTRCHRRLLAERLTVNQPDMQVIHLM